MSKKKEESVTVDMSCYEHPAERERVLEHRVGVSSFTLDHDAHEVRINCSEDDKENASITVIAVGRIGQHFAAVSNYRFIVDGEPNKSFDEPQDRTEALKVTAAELAYLLEVVIKRFNNEVDGGITLDSMRPADFEGDGLSDGHPYATMGRILMDELTGLQPRLITEAKRRVSSIEGELNDDDMQYVGGLVNQIGIITNRQYDPRVFMAGLKSREKMGYIESLMLTEQACKYLAQKALPVMGNPDDVKDGETLIERGIEQGVDNLKGDLKRIFHVDVPDDFGLTDDYLKVLKRVAENEHSAALH